MKNPEGEYKKHIAETILTESASASNKNYLPVLAPTSAIDHGGQNPGTNDKQFLNPAKARSTNVQKNLANSVLTISKELKPDSFIAFFKSKKKIAVLLFIALQGAWLMQLQNPTTFIVLGELGGKGSDQRNDTIASYEEAMRLSSKNVILPVRLAQLLFIGKDYSGAQLYAKQSLKIKDNENAYNILGDIALVKNDLQAAESAYSSALSRNDRDAFSIAKLGWLRKQAGDAAAATELFEKATKIQPGIALDFHHMGYCALNGASEEDRNPKIAEIYEDLAVDLHVERIDPLRLGYAHMNRIQALTELYRPKEAEAEARDLLIGSKDGMTIGDTYDYLKTADRQLADYDALEKDSLARSKILNQAPNDFDLAEVRLFKKKYADAIRFAERAIAANNNQKWSTLIKNSALTAIHKPSNFSQSKLDMEGTLTNEIKNLKEHGLNNRAADLETLLSNLK